MCLNVCVRKYMHAYVRPCVHANMYVNTRAFDRCAEIESGDVIESLDGRKCRGISQAELGALIMGAEGSQVQLELRKGSSGTLVVVQATRRRAAGAGAGAGAGP